jgi:hypothetical protein
MTGGAMKARSESTLTLEEVAEHFERWRGSKRKGDRIPEQLWSEAIGLVGAYGISRVTGALRLSATDLNKRRGIIEAGRSRKAGVGESTFVEIDPVLMDQAPGPESGAVWMELERPDGVRLRIRATHGVDMLGMVERFMEARSCCS